MLAPFCAALAQTAADIDVMTGRRHAWWSPSGHWCIYTVLLISRGDLTVFRQCGITINNFLRGLTQIYSDFANNSTSVGLVYSLCLH